VGANVQALLRNDRGAESLAPVPPRPLVADRVFPLRGDVTFAGLDRAAVDAFARFGPLDLFVVLHLQVIALLFEAANDLVDLVADRRRIDLNPVVHLREFAQERLGNLAIGGNNDLTRLTIDYVQRNFFSE